MKYIENSDILTLYDFTKLHLVAFNVTWYRQKYLTSNCTVTVSEYSVEYNVLVNGLENKKMRT